MAPCPVCNGSGVVPGSFYGPSSAEVVTCRSCGGRQTIDPQEAAANVRGAGDDPRDLTGS